MITEIFFYNLGRTIEKMKNILLLLLVLFLIFIFESSFAESKSSLDYSVILQKNIFFTPFEKKQESSIPVFITQINQPQSLDKTHSLVGTFVFLDEPEKSTVVLREFSTNKMLFLKKGDIVVGNTIILIQDDSVIFESAFGERFALTQAGIKFTHLQTPTFYFRVNLKTAFETISAYPEILSTIKFVSVGKDTAGFKIQDIEPQSIYEMAGLMVNDIIVQIDDMMLKTPDDAIDAYKNILITGRKFTTIKILRNNKSINLVYILE
ncbi:MAG TPA: hypothetical protein PKX05_03345 [bacterium]|mgnify:FL=1|nr:hypothetical protein [bacterium]